MKNWIIGTALAVSLMSGTPAMADQTYKLKIDGLACPYCAYGAEKKLKAVSGVKKVKIYINKGLVVVTLRDGAKFTKGQVQKLIKDAGFALRGFQKV